MNLRKYTGIREFMHTEFGDISPRSHIKVDGKPLSMSLKFRQMKVSAFDYGYIGKAGPAALAHSLLVHEFSQIMCLEHAEIIADQTYKTFMQEVIALLPNEPAKVGREQQSGWELKGNAIRAWFTARFPEYGILEIDL